MKELSEEKKLEALGLSVFHPMAEGLALTTLDGNKSALSGFKEYLGTKDGLQSGFGERSMRPVTEGWLGFLREDYQRNVRTVLELAGF